MRFTISVQMVYCNISRMKRQQREMKHRFWSCLFFSHGLLAVCHLESSRRPTHFASCSENLPYVHSYVSVEIVYSSFLPPARFLVRWDTYDLFIMSSTFGKALYCLDSILISQRISLRSVAFAQASSRFSALLLSTTVIRVSKPNIVFF